MCLKTVTALWYGNLKVFALALCEAMEQGKRYLLRTAASLVKVMGGISICIFPGNVGEDAALRETVEILLGR